MKVSDFLKVMFVITFTAVLYIHLQMSIYDLAYQGKKKEDTVEKLAENNVMMKNDILRLKSADHIGRELLEKEKDYKFASRSNVVEVETTGGNPISGLLAFAKF
ncbi:MAG: hypothetical protein HQL22_00915 [Candidatus Omnitrophica bacterium]|nr:hypothetical protein [Candidatus Omnitrophota bacterium]